MLPVKHGKSLETLWSDTKYECFHLIGSSKQSVCSGFPIKTYENSSNVASRI